MLAPMSTILLVEDVEDDRRVVRQVVNHMLNVTLLEASNGAEAVALARAARPRIILMDLSLPIMDGWQAIATLKADPHTASIPIIALTAHAMLTDGQRARQAGCAGYLAKPLDPQAFKTSLERMLAV